MQFENLLFDRAASFADVFAVCVDEVMKTVLLEHRSRATKWLYKDHQTVNDAEDTSIHCGVLL